MRKLTITLTAVLAAVLFLTASPAYAQATVVKDFGCVIIPADSGLPIFLFTSTKTHETDSASGNTTLTCHFDIPAGFVPATTMQHSGFLCGTFAGFTTNTHSVTTKGGKVHLKCQINPSQP